MGRVRLFGPFRSLSSCASGGRSLAGAISASSESAPSSASPSRPQACGTSCVVTVFVQHRADPALRGRSSSELRRPGRWRVTSSPWIPSHCAGSTCCSSSTSNVARSSWRASRHIRSGSGSPSRPGTSQQGLRTKAGLSSSQAHAARRRCQGLSPGFHIIRRSHNTPSTAGGRSRGRPHPMLLRTSGHRPRPPAPGRLCLALRTDTY